MGAPRRRTLQWPRHSCARSSVGGRTDPVRTLRHWSVYERRIGVGSREGRYRPLLLEALAPVSRGQDLAPWGPPRAASSTATETPFSSWACPDSGAWTNGGTHDKKSPNPDRHKSPTPDQRQRRLGVLIGLGGAAGAAR